MAAAFAIACAIALWLQPPVLGAVAIGWLSVVLGAIAGAILNDVLE